MAHSLSAHDRLMNEKELATYLNVSVAAIRRWRYQSSGPSAVRLGTSIRYLPADVQAWIANRRVA